VTVRDLLRGLPVFDRPLPAFDTESVPGEPSALFLSWLHEAIDAGVSEPHAMTLSTVDADGRPDARVLILKDIDADGWQFATATTSAKGAQLAGRPHAARPRDRGGRPAPGGGPARGRGGPRGLHADPGHGGILAGRQPAAARSAALPAHRQRLDHRTAVALN
jgi:hypothetical protein